VFTELHHFTLSWASSGQSTSSLPVSLRSILILFFPLMFYIHNFVWNVNLSHACYMSGPLILTSPHLLYFH
jgi:hypothetical protein